jgi:uncharacterized Zn finger protein
MKIPSLNKNFDEDILRRGYDYYMEDRVKNLLVDGNKVTATVIGNRNYRTKINLKTEEFRCTCPCGFNCKHLAAVLYSLKNNKSIETISNIKDQLNKKSKNELIDILQKVLSSEPRFKKLLENNQDIMSLIESLKIEDDGEIDDFIEEIDQLYEQIMKRDGKINELVALFKKCFFIYNNFEVVEPMEDSMFDILGAISKEAKRLPEKERQKLLQELVDLTSEYDFFLDSIDDRGIKLNFK